MGRVLGLVNVCGAFLCCIPQCCCYTGSQGWPRDPRKVCWEWFLSERSLKQNKAKNTKHSAAANFHSFTSLSLGAAEPSLSLTNGLCRWPVPLKSRHLNPLWNPLSFHHCVLRLLPGFCASETSLAFSSVYPYCSDHQPATLLLALGVLNECGRYSHFCRLCLIFTNRRLA